MQLSRPTTTYPKTTQPKTTQTRNVLKTRDLRQDCLARDVDQEVVLLFAHDGGQQVALLQRVSARELREGPGTRRQRADEELAAVRADCCAVSPYRPRIVTRVLAHDALDAGNGQVVPREVRVRQRSLPQVQ